MREAEPDAKNDLFLKEEEYLVRTHCELTNRTPIREIVFWGKKWSNSPYLEVLRAEGKETVGYFDIWMFWRMFERGCGL